MGWVSKFDNTFWAGEDGQSAWSGSAWVITPTGGVNLGLEPVGGWVTGYRPTKIRITASISVNQAIFFGTYNTAGNDYLNTGHVNPGSVAVTAVATAFEYDLDFSPTGNPMDIGLVDYNPAVGHVLTITNIEFFESAGPTAFWQNKVTCTETDA